MELLPKFEQYLKNKMNDNGKWEVSFYKKNVDYYGITASDLKGRVFEGNIYSAYYKFAKYVEEIIGENTMEKDLEYVSENLDYFFGEDLPEDDKDIFETVITCAMNGELENKDVALSKKN